MKRWWKATWCSMIVLTMVVVTGQALTATAATKAVKPRVNRTVKAPTKHQYILVMGHGAGDSGARGNGTTEAMFLRQHLLPQLRKYARKVKHSQVTFYNPKQDIVKDTLTYHKGSYKLNRHATVVMFHLDAAGGHGGHVIIHKRRPTARDKRLAQVIKKYVGLNRAYHGYSYRTDLKNCNVLRKRGIDYSLIETGFITNRTDMAHIRKNIGKIAKADIEAITHENIR
ncbi:N-acetylmuramoyl-L-alanine amidase [Levilactobacillus brevis]|uniref:N-acetylmuramoyl-L-alanine amidase n=1 Tax=Levilactobacillus brevis TaxID=1580 RepID=UPI0003FDDD96|nr:N-acetylmuramoyl-L-alanine amidase [Levilactobacillus brevis]KID44890.1 N-acetylmuramoyl-L-alanine amidase [Levilactobacillus brevis]MCU0199664.1 N-acetylmuramoyl-L-alanine amidase [Levilactobacillus brevis]ODP95171.1 N-acetylmuramoyl-L-alanine amidase [Levilactobacillus brevis]ORJ54553.1 N-acetylmuramoyl-L-alanine amidase [Levilactobacillus brevis]QCZ43451.1 Amidase [Levilactobacillus brevis]